MQSDISEVFIHIFDGELVKFRSCIRGHQSIDTVNRQRVNNARRAAPGKLILYKRYARFLQHSPLCSGISVGIFLGYSARVDHEEGKRLIAGRHLKFTLRSFNDSAINLQINR